MSEYPCLACSGSGRIWVEIGWEDEPDYRAYQEQCDDCDGSGINNFGRKARARMAAEASQSRAMWIAKYYPHYKIPDPESYWPIDPAEDDYEFKLHANDYL